MTMIRQGAAAELWGAAIREACGHGAGRLDEALESYLVFVLLRHQRDQHLLARTQALAWLEAQARAGEARTDALRDVGDRCLLIAGLFPELAERRRVRIEYFIDLGRGAYRDIADAGRNAYAALFAQLAQAYHALVQVLRDVREPRLPAAAAGWPARAGLH